MNRSGRLALAAIRDRKAFLDELRSITQVIILSDTFEQFASPLMRQLGWPALFCHRLEVDGARVHFDIDTARVDDAVRRLGELGVRSLVSHPPTLEELFLRHYGDELARESELADRFDDDGK